MRSRLQTPRGRGLGWKPDHPDRRDAFYAAPPHLMSELPPVADQRPQMPPIYDQLSIGSCTGNSVGAALQYMHKKEGHPNGVRTPSRLMLYYLARAMEGTTALDAGAAIRDVVKGAAKYGACFEDPHDQPPVWPYDITRFAARPDAACFAAGKNLQALQYQRISEYNAPTRQLRAAVASGLPVIFGITLFASFESMEVEKTGIVPMPEAREDEIGGHAMLIVGYDTDGTIGPARHFLVRNSWGSGWGEGGYCWMPFEMLTATYSSDWWTISKVE